MQSKNPLILAATGAGFFLAGSAIAFTLLYQPLDPEDVPLPLVRIDGTPIEYGQPLMPQLTRIGRTWLRGEIVLTDGEFEHSCSRQSLGAWIDYHALEHRILYVTSHRAALDSVRGARIEGGRPVVDVALTARLDLETAHAQVLGMKYVFDRDPSSARLDLETRQVIPHKTGRLLVVDETIHRIERALDSDEPRIEIAREQSVPQSRTEEIRNVEIGTVLAWFETPYCMMKHCWDRTANLELGASILDGTIIGPGETFDFNEALGERTEARGFKPAPTIESGELVPTPGGGTCQTASTLHAAAFFAGLDIIERRTHSRPSGYILLGLDSTVTYPNINLMIRNPYQFPVAIHYKVADGKMRVEILGKWRPRMVHFVRRITQRVPWEEKTVEVEDWPAGVKVIEQLGVDGFRVRRYRIQWEGTRAWREVTEDYYPPTPQIVKVGVNKSMSAKGFVVPAGDTHTPYQADKRIKYYLDWNDEYQKIIANW